MKTSPNDGSAHWDAVPEIEQPEEAQPASGCRGALAAALVTALLIIATALALFVHRGCG